MRSTWIVTFAVALGIAATACKHDHDGDRGDGSAVAGSLEDLAEGQRVRVRVDDGAYPYAATHVEILAQEAGEAEAAGAGAIEGPVTAVDPDAGTVTVLGLKIAVGAATELGGIEGLAELAAGQAVRIDVRAGADGALSAARLELRPAQLEGVVIGRVPDGDAVKIGVLGRTVRADADTEIVRSACGKGERRGKGHHDDDEGHDDDDD